MRVRLIGIWVWKLAGNGLESVNLVTAHLTTLDGASLLSYSSNELTGNPSSGSFTGGDGLR